MEEFVESWLKYAREDIREACLEALTILALRNITEDYAKKYEALRNTLLNIKSDNKYINKLQQVYDVFNPKPKECESSVKKWWE